MKLRPESLRVQLNMDEDSSSDWDSLTEPVPAKIDTSKLPPSRLDSDDEREKKSASPPIIPPQQSRTESPVWTPRKDKPKNKAQPPDVNFRPASSNQSPQHMSGKRAPGKDRKGNTYDPPRSTASPPISLAESDEDAALAALRKTYEENRPRPEPSQTDSNPDTRQYESPGAAGRLATPGKGRWNDGKQQAPPSASAGSLDARASQTTAITMATEDTSPRYHSDPRQGARETGPPPSGFPPRGTPGARSEGSVESGDGLMMGGQNRRPDTRNNDEKRVEVYYFDEAYTDRYESKPERSVAVMERYADRAEVVIHGLWKEVFAVLRIVTLVITIFFTELVKFVVTTLLRPVHHIIQILGDHLVKPFLSALFNGFLQPCTILAYNMAVGFRLAVGPLLDVPQRIVGMAANLLASFRLVEINRCSEKDCKIVRAKEEVV